MRHRWIAGITLALVVAGCGGTGPEPLTGSPTPTAVPTPLATEAIDTPAPARSSRPGSASPAPTKAAGSFYRPPGWDGVSDVDCKDFDTHAHAVSFFKGTGGTKSKDPYGLDREHDGNPCETLP